MQIRKQELILNTDKLSETLKNTILRTDNLKQELSAVQNLVEQYELANQRNLHEIEEQTRQNEEIAT